MQLFSSNEILIMAMVIGILVIVLAILNFCDFKEILKKRNYSNEVLDDIENKVEEIAVDSNKAMDVIEEIEVIDFDDEKITEVKPNTLEEVQPVIMEDVKEEIVYQTVEDKKMAVKEELARVKEELELQEEINIDDVITNFEIEQEANAIISYDELSKIGDRLYDSNELTQYDDGDEPITIDEVINKFNAINNETVAEEKEEVVQIVEEEPTYQSVEHIPFISSIYGLEKKHEELEFENTATYEKLSKENMKNEDFLNQLTEAEQKTN